MYLNELAFNRTIVELKCSSTMLLYYMLLTFNRTIVELKWLP